MEFKGMIEPKYREIINSYLNDQNEQLLYQGQKLSRKLIEHQISPEEIISLHKSIMLENEATQENIIDSFDILLEVMMGYGLAYREHQSLRTQQLALKSEIEVAANMQQTLLGTSIPEIDGLDIGAISVPARQMNGDYFHFVKDDNQCVGIAIADVIGKGIPAALSMSMIKYAMDSFPETRHNPGTILGNLNRVVEQNVDPSMFITMCYGVYNPWEHKFHYATAGHEPGFFYHATKKEFEDLDGKGLLLGIDKKTKYQEYEKSVGPGDMIVLLSDGVTECRTEEGFIEREDLVAFIDKYIHLPAQEIVTNVYKDLERLQEFELRDDFTLIILKRKQ
ncbi:PP2C family protein-serine/threonine phosphatase [Lederbergia citrea]|uniref:PP2C family protein-serine/threonine phosphatase n=1 Tax=Lederbergia citrea TaxID=2833581 RepID=A0A942UX22_9BACI|nr:PP2C family protein-serine/threonine phosphatase [Lederbergia citrea]MBS4178607.1 PP2C family protein-serine/threonine phosphatase [Lederbergia citrea]MBS4205294.1 PP2C family protein-serine/threonine phosphatase [Lederbergia citrea]MBS4224394.1 PP2C family protein-serine/threonine phosphatase [Lederbergia citrea]